MKRDKKRDEAQASLFDAAEVPLPRPSLRERLASTDSSPLEEPEALAPLDETAQSDHDEHPDTPVFELIGEDPNGRVFREAQEKAEAQIHDSLMGSAEHPDLVAEVRANTPEDLDDFDTVADLIRGPMEPITFEGKFRDPGDPCPVCEGSGMMAPPQGAEKVPCEFC